MSASKTTKTNERIADDLKGVIEKNNLGESFTHNIGPDADVKYAPTIYKRNDPSFQEKMRVNMIARSITDRVYGPGSPNDPEIMKKVSELESSEQAKRLHQFILGSIPKGDVGAYERAMSLFPEIRQGVYQLIDERMDRIKGSIKRKLEGPKTREDWMFLYEQNQGRIAEDDTSFLLEDVKDPQVNPGDGDGWFKKGIVNFMEGSGIFTKKSNKTTALEGASMADSVEYFYKKFGWGTTAAEAPE